MYRLEIYLYKTPFAHHRTVRLHTPVRRLKQPFTSAHFTPILGPKQKDLQHANTTHHLPNSKRGTAVGTS